MERRELLHHLFILLWLVRVNCRAVLSQIVEARELFATVTGERTFAGVLAIDARAVDQIYIPNALE